MQLSLKSAFRPLYRALVQTPLLQEILRRECQYDWEKHFRDEFVHGEHGRAYGVSKADRIQLVQSFKRNTSEIPSGTSEIIHIALAREILSISPQVKGDVIECGAWKGASTASLSLVCRLVGRRLLVADSFAGLPDEGQQLHIAPHFGIYGYYHSGMFSGRLEEVQANVKRLGALEVCEFVPGFYDQSLGKLTNPIVFAFLDVDLVSSTRDCLRYLWPLLIDNGTVYTDDAGDMAVVGVFFNDGWWQATLAGPAPGYVGSGCGLPLNPKYSPLGYTRKLAPFNAAQWQRAPHLYYPDRPLAAQQE